MRILGIDPSLNGTGLAVIDTKGRRGDEKVLAWQRVRTDPDATLQHRIATVAFQAADITAKYSPEYAGIERSPYVGRSVHTALMLAQLVGGIGQELHTRRVELVDINTSTVADQIGIPANTQRAKRKAAAKARALHAYGLELTDDEAEAIEVAVCVPAILRKLANEAAQERIKLPRAGKGRRKR